MILVSLVLILCVVLSLLRDRLGRVTDLVVGGVIVLYVAFLYFNPQ